MATNLRLRHDAAIALQEYSARTGLSQQEILRRALDAYLENEAKPASTYRASLIPPRRPFQRSEELLVLPDGVTSDTLLDRDDRF
ncbi:ribbon-helix-helix protein, CopG family [Agromyces sp. NPDC058484]|uniref:ribbon-helix-helix protein, CopG family n=1 Tax=Agromyces sp. NPDC058484 TaxID=3346524 RepID=UPI00365CB9F3